jgi:hypothetical protein
MGRNIYTVSFVQRSEEEFFTRKLDQLRISPLEHNSDFELVAEPREIGEFLPGARRASSQQDFLDLLLGAEFTMFLTGPRCEDRRESFSYRDRAVVAYRPALNCMPPVAGMEVTRHWYRREKTLKEQEERFYFLLGCEHHWARSRSNQAGTIVDYTCTKCGTKYTRDTSD